MARKRKVLAVDDNPVNLGILEEMLGDHYCVHTAQSGAEAIREATKLRPAFVLLDVMMPQMDGLEVSRQLRTMPGLRDCVIIMVSAKAMPSERIAGLDAGADDYVTKPFDEVELLETLRSFEDHRRTATAELVSDESDEEAIATQ